MFQLLAAKGERLGKFPSSFLSDTTASNLTDVHHYQNIGLLWNSRDEIESLFRRTD